MEQSPDGTASSGPQAPSHRLPSTTVPLALPTRAPPSSTPQHPALFWLPTSVLERPSKSTTALSSRPSSLAHLVIPICLSVTLPSLFTSLTIRSMSHMPSKAPLLPITQREVSVPASSASSTSPVISLRASQQAAILKHHGE